MSRQSRTQRRSVHARLKGDCKMAIECEFCFSHEDIHEIGCPVNVHEHEEEPAVIAGEEPQPAPLTDQERAELVGYGLIFAQLLQSDRFRTFFQVNYDLVKVVDDGEK